MKDKIFSVLQRVGRSFMLPIAILPVASLLLGIGGSFTNETMLEAYHLTGVMGKGTVLNALLQVMNDAGNIVFGNLPIIFAMGVAIGMANKEKEVAALAAAISFFIMHASISAMITINGGAEAMLNGATTSVCGITSLQMGVFGGIIVGLGVAALHNKYYKIELPQVVSFFGGTRFVPIISALVYTFVGIAMFFVWPVVQKGIYAVGDVVIASGYFGTWVYGLMERLLIPFGLHHVFYLPFWQTAVGGTMEVNGQLIEGAQNIFFAQLADPSAPKFAVEATRFMSGKFPLMIFGLPGAALAMYRCARPEKRKVVGGLLLSAALTSMLTGITEPIEFTFLFVAPALYGIHCVFAGAAYMLMHICKVGVGMTFSGGIIDMVLFGILPGQARTNWIWIVIVGIGYFIVYYFLFTFLIKKFDLKTPGREDDDEETKLYTKADYLAKGAKAEDATSDMIMRGLGGKKNITTVDCCATRLRCTVEDPSLVREGLLKASGASGVIHKGNGVQVIYGPHVTTIKSNLEDYLETAPNTLYSGEDVETAAADSADSKKKVSKKFTIYSPMSGMAGDISEADDEAFAGKMMGDGAIVTPDKATVVAPCDGTIGFVFDTKHAIGMETEDGTGLLLHVGIDTVSLGGNGFEVLVENGQKVKKGDALMNLDLDYLTKNAKSMTSPIIVTDVDADKVEVFLQASGHVEAGEPLYEVTIYE